MRVLLIVVLMTFCLSGFANDSILTSPLTAQAPAAIAVDPSGNVYITGEFQGGLDFNPAIGEDTHTATGSGFDTYVTRFNADGSYGWTQIITGNLDESPKAIATNGTSVYITGLFDSPNLGIGTPGAVSYTHLTLPTNREV